MKGWGTGQGGAESALEQIPSSCPSVHIILKSWLYQPPRCSVQTRPDGMATAMYATCLWLEKDSPVPNSKYHTGSKEEGYQRGMSSSSVRFHMYYNTDSCTACCVFNVSAWKESNSSRASYWIICLFRSSKCHKTRKTSCLAARSWRQRTYICALLLLLLL